MYRRWFGMLLLGAFVVGVAPAPRTDGEEKRPPARAEKLPADLDFIYESGSSFVSLRPGDLLDAAPLKQLPPRLKRELERMGTEAQRHFGIPVSDMERVSFLLPDEPQEGPIAVVRTLKAYDRDAVLRSALGEGFRPEKFKGFSLFTGKEVGEVTLCAIDAQTFAIGQRRGLKDVITRADGRTTPRPHGLALEWAAGKHQVVVGATAEPLLGMLIWRSEARSAERDPPRAVPTKQGESKTAPVEKKSNDRPRDPAPPPESIREKQGKRSSSADAQFVSLQRERPAEDRHEQDFKQELRHLPLQALPYKPLLLAKSFAASIDLGEESKAQWQILFDDEDAAKDGEMSTRVALYVFREALGRLPHEMHASAELTPKVTGAIREVQAALRAAPLKRTGATLEGSLTLKTSEATLKPFFAEMDKAATRMEGMNNLRQIGLAMHSAHDVYGQIPGAAICDKDGKPLLSWRVAILPFIEQDNLYKQFKLDEPWNSEHNMKLLERMPPQYAVPNRVLKKGETCFLVFTGPNTPFDSTRRKPGIGPRLTEFTDGTSNTLLVVESAETVPWTKPDDLVVDPKKPLPKLGGSSPDAFLALFADGSVRPIPMKINEQTLRWLIDPADGNVIPDWEQIEPRRDRNPRRPGEGSGSEAPKPVETKPLPPERKP